MIITPIVQAEEREETVVHAPLEEHGNSNSSSVLDEGLVPNPSSFLFDGIAQTACSGKRLINTLEESFCPYFHCTEEPYWSSPMTYLHLCPHPGSANLHEGHNLVNGEPHPHEREKEQGARAMPPRSAVNHNAVTKPE